MRVFFSVLGVLSATSGLIFNAFILLVLLWEKRFHSANHLLLLHLASADTLFCLQVMITSLIMPFISSLNDFFSNSLLYVYSTLWNTLPPVILWTICGMSLERYFTICFPFSYGERVTRFRAGIWILISWMISLTLSLGPTVGICSYKEPEYRLFPSMSCLEHEEVYGQEVVRRKSPQTLLFASTVILWNVLIPCLVIVSTQLHVLFIARSQQGRIVSSHNISHNIIGSCVTCTRGNSESPVGNKSPFFKQVNQEAKLNPKKVHRDSYCPGLHPQHHVLPSDKSRGGVSLVSLLFSSLILFWIPSSLVFLIESSSGREGTLVLTSFTTVLLTFVPTVNAYVFGVKSRFLRQTFKRLIQRYLYKHEASLEIERRISLRSHSSSRFSLAWHSLTHPSSLPANLLVANANRYKRRYSAPSLFTSQDLSQLALKRDSVSGHSVVRRFSVHSVHTVNTALALAYNPSKDTGANHPSVTVTCPPLDVYSLSSPLKTEYRYPSIPVFKLTEALTKNNNRQQVNELHVGRGNNLKSFLSPIEEVVHSSSVSDTCHLEQL